MPAPALNPAKKRPPADDLISIVAVLCAYHLKAEQVCDWTGLSWDRTRKALAYLRGEYILRKSGPIYSIRQSDCGGSCMRRGQALKGTAVCVDPETLRWYCEECWDAEVEQVRRLVDDG